MLTQNGDTPLHLAVMWVDTPFMERLLSTPGVDVNIRNNVSCSAKHARNWVRNNWGGGGGGGGSGGRGGGGRILILCQCT